MTEHYTDTWANIDTDLREAGQHDLADRVKQMRGLDDEGLARAVARGNVRLNRR